MLGYYLGGGSVKVDCLFDTANFVTKSAAGNFIANGALGVGGAADPAARLHVRGGGAGAAQARVESSATQANVAFYNRSEENTSELQSLMRISYAVFCLKKKKITIC